MLYFLGLIFALLIDALPVIPEVSSSSYAIGDRITLELSKYSKKPVDVYLTTQCDMPSDLTYRKAGAGALHNDKDDAQSAFQSWKGKSGMLRIDLKEIKDPMCLKIVEGRKLLARSRMFSAIRKRTWKEVSKSITADAKEITARGGEIIAEATVSGAKKAAKFAASGVKEAARLVARGGVVCLVRSILFTATVCDIVAGAVRVTTDYFQSLPYYSGNTYYSGGGRRDTIRPSSGGYVRSRYSSGGGSTHDQSYSCTSCHDYEDDDL